MKSMSSTRAQRTTRIGGAAFGATIALLLLPNAARAQGTLAAGPRATTAPEGARRTDKGPVLATRGIRMPLLILAHRVDLGLTTEQAVRVAAIAVRLDSAVTPLEAEIDTLTLHGDATDWQRVSEEQGAALREQSRRRSTLVATVRDQLQQSRTAALAALTDTQQRAATALEDAQLRAEAERLRAVRAGGGWKGVNARP
jgi:hypothetical protein